MESSEKTYQRYLTVTLSVLVPVLLLIFLFVYAVDPYQQFRGSDKYINDGRMEIPGVSRHHDYNAVMMGSSMANNNNCHLVDSLFSTSGVKWKTRNFTLTGGMSDDYNVILSRLQRDGKVRYIMLDFDFFSFANKRKAIQTCLYSDSPFDKLKYAYNYTTLRNCLRKLTHPCDVDDLCHFKSPNNKAAAVDSYRKAVASPMQKEGYDFDFDYLKRTFDECLCSHVKSMDGVEWYIYFPPYSAFEFVRYRDEGNWPDIVRFKEYVCKTLLACPNVKLFDFQADTSYIMAFDEYMDIRHFSWDFNDRIVTDMSKGSHQMSLDTYRDSVSYLNRLVMSLQVDSLINN